MSRPSCQKVKYTNRISYIVRVKRVQFLVNCCNYLPKGRVELSSNARVTIDLFLF